MIELRSKVKGPYVAIAVGMSVIALSTVALIPVLSQEISISARINNYLSFIGMLFALILYICGTRNNRYGRRRAHAFAALIVTIFAGFLLSECVTVLEGRGETALIAFETVSYILSVIEHLLFWVYLREDLVPPGKRFYGLGIVAVFSLLYVAALIVNLFTGMMFYVGENGHLVYTGMLWELLAPAVIYITYIVYLIVAKCSRLKKAFMVAYVLFNLLYGFTCILYYTDGPFEGTVESAPHFFMLLTAYLIFFSIWQEDTEELYRHRVTIAERDSEIAEEERRLMEAQTTVMLSQIQPHFLYNALSAIRSLCKSDPARAYDSLGDFSDYLRANMDSLQGARLTTFVREMEHVRTYLSIEKLRFGSDLRVVYDIGCSDFVLPPLTIQPLVENAVRHGICKNEYGGTVTIATRRVNNEVIITVSDDGPGFLPDVPPADDGKSHVGLSSVRRRLELLVDGTLMVESRPGAGTVVTIRIKENGV